MSNEPLKILISYSHRDHKALERLRAHLKPLIRDDQIDFWDDSRIRAGQLWQDEIEMSLNSIAAAILLVSADFLASDFIHERELPPILTAWEQRGIKIYWVLLSTCDLAGYESLRRLQAVNPGLKPLSEMNRDQKEKVWAKLVAAISQDFKESGSISEIQSSSIVASDFVAKEQFAVLRKAASHVYRARNLSRSLNHHPLGIGEGTDDLRALRDSLADLIDLLYQERAILPGTVFRIIHTLKYTLIDFIAAIDALRRSDLPDGKQAPNAAADIRKHYQKLDDNYGRLLRIIQKRLGVGD